MTHVYETCWFDSKGRLCRHRTKRLTATHKRLRELYGTDTVLLGPVIDNIGGITLVSSEVYVAGDKATLSQASATARARREQLAGMTPSSRA